MALLPLCAAKLADTSNASALEFPVPYVRPEIADDVGAFWYSAIATFCEVDSTFTPSYDRVVSVTVMA